MLRAAYRVRRAGLIACGVACVVGGLLLVWRVTRPDVMFGVGTLELAVVVGLLVLPGLTLGAMRLHRGARGPRGRGVRRDQDREPLAPARGS